jgi:predicted DCC family thiol-disulfide oxidoreductase YuxK
MDIMKHPIILYDGVCYLCNWIVQFALTRDAEGHLRFASLQSDMGQDLLREQGIPTEEFKTSLLIENGKAYMRSTGALRTVRYLRFPWPLLYGFIIVPPFIRDAIYDLVARKRYDWFGQMEACPLPPPELRERFLS